MTELGNDELPTMDARQALEWIDNGIAEFFGAMDEGARHIAAQMRDGIAEGAPTMHLEVSARLNGFMLKLMELGNAGAAAIQRGDVPATLEAPAPVPAPAPEPVTPVPAPEPQPAGEPVH